MIDWIRRWLIWRKHNRNSKLHQYLVLFKIKKSPTMMWVLLPEEWKDIQLAFYRGIIERMDEEDT